jgi:hypothetical protein
MFFLRDGVSKRAGVDTNARWPWKLQDRVTRKLSVKTWLEQLDKNVDTLSITDKLVWDRQIGGLGDRLEAPLYPETAVDGSKYLLLEMRDLSGGGMDGIENFLIEIEKNQTMAPEPAVQPVTEAPQTRNWKCLYETDQ